MEQKTGLGARMQNLVKSVSEKSGEMVENARLNTEINNLQEELENLQLELGQAYFQAHRDDRNAEFYDSIQKMIDCEREIRIRDERVLANKGLRYCEFCDTVIGLKDEFCSKCGGRLMEVPEAQAILPCRNCGFQVSSKEAYCPQCGLRLKQ